MAQFSLLCKGVIISLEDREKLFPSKYCTGGYNAVNELQMMFVHFSCREQLMCLLRF